MAMKSMTFKSTLYLANGNILNHDLAPYIELYINPVESNNYVTINWNAHYCAQSGYLPESDSFSKYQICIGDKEYLGDFDTTGKSGKHQIASESFEIDKDSSLFKDVEVSVFFGFNEIKWHNPNTNSKVSLGYCKIEDILSIPPIGWDDDFHPLTCTLRFHKDYEDYSNPDKYYNYSVELEVGDTYTFIEPKRTGRTFKHWVDDRFGKTCYPVDGEGYTVDEGDVSEDEITFYAEWEELSEETLCTITYDANGGSGTPSSVTKRQGEKITISSKEPTKTGYNFLGWTESFDDSIVYKPNSIYTVTDDVTLYAVWFPVKYTITYDANGGKGAPPNQSKYHGQTIKVKPYNKQDNPYRTGYKFLGWSTTPNGDVKYLPDNDFYNDFSTNASTTLYAVWEETISNLQNIELYRCDAEGNKQTDGLYARIKFDYTSIGMTTAISVEWRNDTDYEEYKSSNSMGVNVWDGETGSSILFSGDFDKYIVVTDATFNNNKKYTFRIKVYDDGCEYNQEEGAYVVMEEATLSNVNYFMDFKTPESTGEVGGMGIGTEAGEDGVLDIGYPTRFLGGILYTDLKTGANFNALTTPNNFALSALANYPNCPTTLNGQDGTLIVEPVGVNGNVRQIAKGNSTNYEKHERYYDAMDDSWTEWKLVYSSEFGKVYGGNAVPVQITTAGSTVFSGETITVPAGVYILGARVNFASTASTGTRANQAAIYVKPKSKPSYSLLIRERTNVESASSISAMSISEVYNATEETNIYAGKSSNVVESGTANVYITAVRIA